MHLNCYNWHHTLAVINLSHQFNGVFLLFLEFRKITVCAECTGIFKYWYKEFKRTRGATWSTTKAREPSPRVLFPNSSKSCQLAVGNICLCLIFFLFYNLGSWSFKKIKKYFGCVIFYLSMSSSTFISCFHIWPLFPLFLGHSLIYSQLYWYMPMWAHDQFCRPVRLDSIMGKVTTSSFIEGNIVNKK